jgi:hypothetical protein
MPATASVHGASDPRGALQRDLLPAAAWRELSRSHLAALEALRTRWRLTACQTSAILWIPVADLAFDPVDEPIALQPESLERLALADDIDLTVARLLGSEELVAFWLRMPNSVLGETPIAALMRQTSQLRQLRWRLRGELADRRAARNPS